MRTTFQRGGRRELSFRRARARWGVGVDRTGAVDEDNDIGVTEYTSLGLVIYIGIMHT